MKRKERNTDGQRDLRHRQLYKWQVIQVLGKKTNVLNDEQNRQISPDSDS